MYVPRSLRLTFWTAPYLSTVPPCVADRLPRARQTPIATVRPARGGAELRRGSKDPRDRATGPGAWPHGSEERRTCTSLTVTRSYARGWRDDPAHGGSSGRGTPVRCRK